MKYHEGPFIDMRPSGVIGFGIVIVIVSGFISLFGEADIWRIVIFIISSAALALLASLTVLPRLRKRSQEKALLNQEEQMFDDIKRTFAREPPDEKQVE